MTSGSRLSWRVVPALDVTIGWHKVVDRLTVASVTKNQIPCSYLIIWNQNLQTCITLPLIWLPAPPPSSGGLRESSGESEPWAGIHPHDSEEVPRPPLLCQHIAMSVFLHLQCGCYNLVSLWCVLYTALIVLQSLSPCHTSICTEPAPHLFLIHIAYYSGIFFICLERYCNFWSIYF